MKINKKSWHYKLYNWSYSVLDEGRYMPETTNLCQYMRQLTIGVFFSTIYALLIKGLVFGCVTVCALLFGYTTSKPFGYHSSPPKFAKYNGLHIFGQELYPIHAIGFTVLGLCQWWLVSHSGWKLPVGIESALFIVVIAAYVFAHSNKISDSGALFSEWVRAKKQGICPLIEFEDEKSE